ncbi:MAG: repeat-containing protein, partial [Verrucomicrobiaceae bacterium]|nr:repeat-containing protein [Verrucomicrobiaceae bacterium]
MSNLTVIWQWVSAGFAILTVAALCAAFFFWRRSRNPTRERFAFWSVGAVVAFAVSCMAMLFGHQLPLVPVLNALAKALNFNFIIAETSPSSTEYAFVFLVLTILVHLVTQIHGNWNGPISVGDHERQQKSLNNGLFTGAAQELNRRVRRLPVVTWNPSHNPNNENALGDAKDSMAWHEQAAELLLLSSSSYHIDIRNGWRDKPGVWLGTAMNGSVGLALIPTQPEIPKDTIKLTMDWITQNSGGNSVEIHIAVQGDNCDYLSDLAVFAEIHSENKLLSNLVNLGDYRSSITHRFTKEPLPESPHSLADAYV